VSSRPIPRRRHRFRRFVAPLLVVLFVLVALLFGVSWLALRDARQAWLHGGGDEAVARAERWSRLHLWPSQYHQLLAAIELTGGKEAAAKAHLDALRGGRIWISAVDKEKVARRLFASGRYADFLAYDAASQEFSERPEVRLYRAAALTAANRVDEADAIARFVDRAHVDPKKVAALQSSIALRRGGSYPLVVDRNGGAIANYVVAKRELVPIDSRYAPLVDKAAGSLTLGAHLADIGVDDTLETTLDPDVQNAAVAALSGFRGSLVAIDPRTNELLAIASTRGNSAPANLALERQYEPGSIVKVLTGLDALTSGVDVKSMFPYHCNGDLMIDGRHFGDWLPNGHGTLATFDDAFAQSCNIVFADIGLRLGADKLRAFMTAAGFDAQTTLGVYPVPLGKIIPPIFNRYETAFLAIGLEHESVNALHVAMLASMMANRGVLAQPRLVRDRRSILGELAVPAPPPPGVRVASAEASEQMVRAMTAVVTTVRGTGRRAAVEGITLAMKTGTAGNRDKGGLQALILAFAPADHPKIAFGIIAEDAGPAELAGAKIAHDFLTAVNRIIPRSP
jgi:transpeptidase family protein